MRIFIFYFSRIRSFPRSENHVMQPLSEPGDFRTISGKIVTILGNKVSTKKGFSRPCTCRVLYTHDVELKSSEENDNELRFHVLFMNKPLQGGLDAPGDADELTTSMISKYIAMFKAHSELESVLSGLAKFANSMMKNCKSSQVSSVRPSFRRCIEKTILRATRIIVIVLNDHTPSTARRRRRPSMNEAFEMQIQQVVE